MLIPTLRAKIHRARVTDANLNYEGSIAISRDLLDVSGINVYERVQVVNLNNGERFETYAIEGKQGEMCLNGPAARLGLIGDTIIVLAYGYIDPAKETLTPKIVQVDTNNRPLSA